MMLTSFFCGLEWTLIFAAELNQNTGHTQNSVDMQSINLCGNAIFAIFIA